MAQAPQPARLQSQDQQVFVAFVTGISAAELAALYSSYRFLAQLGGNEDGWKRDACRDELRRRDPDFVAPPDRQEAATRHFGLEDGATQVPG